MTTDDVLGCARPTSSEREALRRAMHRLEDLGAVELTQRPVSRHIRNPEIHLPGTVTVERLTLAARVGER